MTKQYAGLYMYLFGVAFNAAALLRPQAGLSLSLLGVGDWLAPRFHGIASSPAVLVIIATQALNGILYSYIMKAASNVLRLFVISVSLLFSAALSAYVLAMHLSFTYLVALVLVLAAVVLYNARAVDCGLFRWRRAL